jgi:hypothetical protein
VGLTWIRDALRLDEVGEDVADGLVGTTVVGPAEEAPRVGERGVGEGCWDEEGRGQDEGGECRCRRVGWHGD